MRDFTKNVNNLCELGAGATGAFFNGASSLSFSLWTIPDTADTAGTTRNRLFGTEIGSGDTGFSAMLDDNAGPFSLRIRARSAVGEAERTFLATTAVTVAGDFQHLAGSIDIANDLIITYVNGTRETSAAAFTNATYVTGTYTETDRFGCTSDLPPSATLMYDGGIGHICFWKNYLLTQDDANALVLGLDPRLIDTPVLYWPLLGIESPEPDLMAGKLATITGSLPRRAEIDPIIAFESFMGQNGQLSSTAAPPAVLGYLLRQMAA